MSLKIQFGSGGNILPGWVNTDLGYSDPAARVDITKPLPWHDGVVDVILAEHVIEHVTGPEALRFLDECRRILVPGGIIRVCVPGIDRDQMTIELARELVLQHGHLIFFTDTSLANLLRIAGFRYVCDTERREIDGHHRVIGMDRDDIETIRMEAMK